MRNRPKKARANYFSRLLIICIALLLISMGRTKTEFEENSVPSIATNPSQPKGLDELIPDGTEITFAEFEKTAGAAYANLLRPLGPKTISRNGKTFTMKCSAGSISAPGTTLKVAPIVSCEVTRQGNSIALKNISGVTVDIDYVGGNLAVREAVITNATNGKAVVDAKVEVSSWLPWIPVSVTVDLSKLKNSTGQSP